MAAVMNSSAIIFSVHHMHYVDRCMLSQHMSIHNVVFLSVVSLLVTIVTPAKMTEPTDMPYRARLVETMY